MARQLQRAYDYYNRRFFNGELPAIDVQWSEKVGEDAYGEFSIHDDGRMRIQLDSAMKKHRSWWRLVLLHEMCHVKHRSNQRHSKVWKLEMRRLAAAGAMDSLW